MATGYVWLTEVVSVLVFHAEVRVREACEASPMYVDCLEGEEPT